MCFMFFNPQSRSPFPIHCGTFDIILKIYRVTTCLPDCLWVVQRNVNNGKIFRVNTFVRSLLATLALQQTPALQ